MPENQSPAAAPKRPPRPHMTAKRIRGLELMVDRLEIAIGGKPDGRRRDMFQRWNGADVDAVRSAMAFIRAMVKHRKGGNRS